jgi:hypothetical protein
VFRQSLRGNADKLYEIARLSGIHGGL